MISILTPSIRPEYLNITQECLENQTFQDFEWLVQIGLRNRGYTLPSDWNRLLLRAKGERIVLLQDCIRIGTDALAKIDTLPNEIYTFPVGQVLDFGNAPEWDWRMDYSDKLLPGPNYWETDFACAPRSVFFEVGGYDENFDQGWSWENVEIAWRMNRTGRTFNLEKSITGVALKHDSIVPNPFRNKAENNDKKAEETRKKAERGDFKLTYLHADSTF